MKLTNLTNAQLVNRFAKLINLNEKALREAAAVWMEMRERRMELSGYPSSFHKIMPLIASGKLLPKAVLELAGENTKLLALAEFDLPTQSALLNGKELSVVRGSEVDNVPLVRLTAAETRRVLKGGEIQSPAKQRIGLRKPKKRPLPFKPEEREKLQRTTWRQAFKELWARGTDADRAWAKARF